MVESVEGRDHQIIARGGNFSLKTSYLDCLSSRGLRNEDEAMSKGRSGISGNGVKSRQHCTIVLESSPSAEIASYDYEAALSQPDLAESQTDDNEANSSSIKDCAFENKVPPTIRDLGEESTPKTVCFSTDNQTSGKLHSATQLARKSISRLNITQQECAACKNIVDESDDEVGTVDGSISDSKESSKNPTVLVQSEVKNRGQVDCSARREKNNKHTARIKTSLKDLPRRKIVNSSVLNGKKHSKIPRATTNTFTVARVSQAARISSKGYSKTSSCARSYFTSRSKQTRRGFVTDPHYASVTKTREILEQPQGPTKSVVEIKLDKTKASRTSLKKGEYANAKADPKPCEESVKIQVGSAGDHPSSPPTNSVLRKLRLNNTCRSYNDQRETVNLELSIHDVQDPWSDSKSSPEIRTPRGRWSKNPAISPYAESTSEKVDLSSEYSSDSMRPRKKKCFAEKASSRSPNSKSGHTTNSPRLKARRRARFSFFNTLFDIVFWPFLFLRTNR